MWERVKEIDKIGDLAERKKEKKKRKLMDFFLFVDLWSIQKILNK